MPPFVREPLPDVNFAGAVLDQYRHVCMFVNNRQEADRLLDPFILDGLHHGETLSSIVDPEHRVGHVRHLRQLGLDVPKLLASGRIEIRTWAETHLRNGSFDQEAMLAYAELTMSTTRASRLRMVSDMGWAAGVQNTAQLVEYESRANNIIARYHHVVICVYDTAVHGGDVIIDVLRTHPMVVIGGMLQVNPFFVPPEQLLNELRHLERR